MKKKEVKEVSEEEDISHDDGEEHEEEEVNSGDDWTPNNETGGRRGRGRPRRTSAGKKRVHDDDEDEEEEDMDDEEDEEESESDSGNERKNKKRRNSRKREEVEDGEGEDGEGEGEEDEEEEDEEDLDDEEDEDSDENFHNNSVPAKDFTSGAFVVSKLDVQKVAKEPPVLWRIDGKALLQKYLPFKKDGKTLYKSTSTYSGWSINNKKKYLAARIEFKQQSKQETIVDLNLEETMKGDLQDEKEE